MTERKIPDPAITAEINRRMEAGEPYGDLLESESDLDERIGAIVRRLNDKESRGEVDSPDPSETARLHKILPGKGRPKQ